jgi:tRNA threonylcarbamoyladenosine biosynthesis protein TsaB
LAALAAGARAGTDVDTGRATRAGADPVLAVVDARRGEVYAALDEPGAVRPEPFVAAPRALAERIAGLERSPLTVGDGAVRFRAELQAAGARVAPEDSPLHVIRALHVCRLASEVPAAAPEAVVPEYLRSPDAAPPPPLASP